VIRRGVTRRAGPWNRCGLAGSTATSRASVHSGRHIDNRRVSGRVSFEADQRTPDVYGNSEAGHGYGIRIARASLSAYCRLHVTKFDHPWTGDCLVALASTSDRDNASSLATYCSHSALSPGWAGCDTRPKSMIFVAPSGDTRTLRGATSYVRTPTPASWRSRSRIASLRKVNRN
jgi:hypothetical protein